jgi:hypothetical protein
MKEIDIKETLLNELIQLQSIKDELWTYHPDNKKGIDVVDAYSTISEKITNIEKELEVLN